VFRIIIAGGVINEDGMRELYEGNLPTTSPILNQRIAGDISSSTNEAIMHIKQDEIIFIENLEKEEEESVSYYGCILPIYKIVHNWFKNKKGNSGNERELEVSLLDKSEENDEIKYSNENNSSGGIVQGIYNKFAPKSDKSKSRNMSVALKEEEDSKTESLRNITPIENIKMKLDLTNVSSNGSEVSTATSTPRDRIKIGDNLMDALKKGENTSKDNNAFPCSKFIKLDLEKNKKNIHNIF